MKIKDLEVSKIYTVPLVVISATARETKAKKPYLALDFYDGIENISGNYWDWAGKSIPEKNAILNVNAQITEWQGNKQLNIKGMTANTELHISEFTPNSGNDVSTTYKEAYTLASSISDDFLKALCQGVLEELSTLWLTAPAAVTIHHAYTAGTLIHSLSVARLAKSMAEALPGANIDLIIAGALLHDLGKLFGYRIDGVSCELTDEGKLYDHLFIGAEFIGNYAEENLPGGDHRKLEMLRHIILSHHGTQEHGAVVPPAMLEAHIVFHADALDAAYEMIRYASSKAGDTKWTDRIWALESRPHLTFTYVDHVMSRQLDTVS